MNTENTENTEVEIMPQQTGWDAIEKTNIDVQVSTAKMYPRNIMRSIEGSVAMATMDLETAEECGYAIPRSGKTIAGPSVYLAKIIVSNWGNIRTEAKVVQVTERQVISRGTCWDLETNVASAFEVRRSIVEKSGKRFSDDMITVTGNAANSIAYRNAVFSVIPKAVTDRVYKAARQVIMDGLLEAEKLKERRGNAIKYFNEVYKISEKEVLAMLGKQDASQIGAEEMVELVGMKKSLMSGETTVEDLRSRIKKSPQEKKEGLRNKPSESKLPGMP
jgi:hypothetical protein